ncbi:uncharacterized protein LOC126912429 [Spodoptera frugiperda]|uniref:Uncharacterized protein LOC126912429 n=1 Tax=Spodoptera frugiperda TaxID=7108 RepID=A0A9R0E8S6_SPOFR|nr:uncharacterized protein LOC126912429 [Spodoptera frugiperda]
MLLSIKLLCLLDILVIVISFNIEKIAGSNENVEDDEASIKQALFLIKLLKSDFGKILRTTGIGQDEVTPNYIDDANSTCGLRSDDSNSTTATSTPPVSAPVMGFNRRMMPAFENSRRQGGILNKTKTVTRNETKNDQVKSKNGKNFNNTSETRHDPKNGKHLNDVTTETRHEAKSDKVKSKNGKILNSTSTETRLKAKNNPVKSKNSKNLNNTATETQTESKTYQVKSKNGEEAKNVPEDIKYNQVESRSYLRAGATDPPDLTKSKGITNKESSQLRSEKQTTNMFRSSLKIFLPHSSRLPIPLSENNAFCHFYPTNPIC